MWINNKNIIKNKFQYKITYNNVLYFKINDIVFLKSNPKNKLKIINITPNKIYCEYNNKIYNFSPQTLLHYKYRGLLIYDDKFELSLN